MTVQEAPVVLRCRYRYATDCTAEYEYPNKGAMYAHEKQGPVHADHRVTLRDCPECGARCGDELKRATHLSAEHGIPAWSERRQELDARQVKELYDAQQAAVVPPPAAMPAFPVPQVPLNGPASNGHSPADPDVPDLAAALAAFTELVAEVERLRGVVAALEPDAARYRQITAITRQG